MNIEELLTLYRQYKNWAGHTTTSFEGFMTWLETEYWLKKPMPPEDSKGQEDVDV